MEGKATASGTEETAGGTIRIGHFEFLNGYPLYFGLERGAGWNCFNLVHGVPTTLNRMLLEDNLDISPISSIEYASHGGGLLLFPRLSITSDGAVDSIMLLSNVPIEEIRSVALTGQSATSVVLLKILLKQKYGLEPVYTQLSGDLPAVLERNDAVLLIGDQALIERYGRDRRIITSHAYDLGIEWKEFTGLPMVFALWAVRRDFFDQRADETFEVQDRLLYSVEYCRGHWPQVIDAAAQAYPVEPATLEAYFAKLRYDFTSQFREGLEEYYRRAVEIGETACVPDLEFIEGASARPV